MNQTPQQLQAAREDMRFQFYLARLFGRKDMIGSFQVYHFRGIAWIDDKAGVSPQ